MRSCKSSMAPVMPLRPRPGPVTSHPTSLPNTTPSPSPFLSLYCAYAPLSETAVPHIVSLPCAELHLDLAEGGVGEAGEKEYTWDEGGHSSRSRGRRCRRTGKSREARGQVEGGSEELCPGRAGESLRCWRWRRRRSAKPWQRHDGVGEGE